MSSKAPNAWLPIPAGQPGNRFILRSDLPHFTTDFLKIAPEFVARQPVSGPLAGQPLRL
jgi:hypothetical protein